jgi:excisionase family DNA binding protein
MLQDFARSLSDEVVRAVRDCLSAGAGQRLMTVEDAAVYLGRRPDAVRKLIERGRIPVTRLDNKVQIDRLELDKVIKENTHYVA